MDGIPEWTVLHESFLGDPKKVSFLHWRKAMKIRAMYLKEQEYCPEKKNRCLVNGN